LSIEGAADDDDEVDIVNPKCINVLSELELFKIIFVMSHEYRVVLIPLFLYSSGVNR
jgi:hypothetical protein